MEHYALIIIFSAFALLSGIVSFVLLIRHIFLQIHLAHKYSQVLSGAMDLEIADLKDQIEQGHKERAELSRALDELREIVDEGIKEPDKNESSWLKDRVNSVELPTIHKMLPERPEGEALVCSNCINYAQVNGVDLCKRKKTDMTTTTVMKLNIDCRMERRNTRDGCGPEGRYFVGQDGNHYLQR